MSQAHGVPLGLLKDIARTVRAEYQQPTRPPRAALPRPASGDLLEGSSGDLLIHLPVLVGAVPFLASFLGRSGFGVFVALMYAWRRR